MLGIQAERPNMTLFTVANGTTRGKVKLNDREEKRRLQKRSGERAEMCLSLRLCPEKAL